jgi:hypothetical protein
VSRKRIFPSFQVDFQINWSSVSEKGKVKVKYQAVTGKFTKCKDIVVDLQLMDIGIRKIFKGLNLLTIAVRHAAGDCAEVLGILFSIENIMADLQRTRLWRVEWVEHHYN